MRLYLMVAALAAVTAQDSNMLGHLAQAVEFHASKFQQSLGVLEEFTQKWVNVYQLLYPSEEHQRQQFETHQKRGVFYSAEGSSQQIRDKRREMEERERLELMAKKREYTDNPVLNKKLVLMQQKDLQEKTLRNNKKDYMYYQVLAQKPSASQSSPYLSLQSVSVSNSDVRQLQQTGSQNVYVVMSLIEPYPQGGACNNGGQISNITQTYYLCMQSNDPNQLVFRVDSATYTTLQQNYSDQVFCSQSSYTSNVCVCPQGFYGYQCSEQLNTECFVNITDPPFFQQCQKEDSPYYLYSIHGFDPCYFLDFTQAYDVKFQLTCRYLDDSGQINANGPNVGYQYRDVVQAAIIPKFTYVATNAETGFALMNGSFTPQVAVMFQDWKWLSKQTIFKATVTDIEVAVGNKEQSVNVDFSRLESSDSVGNSSYIVGGRAYFEAYSIGSGLTSYVTKGFFDKANYQEPFRQVTSSTTIILAIAIPLAVIAITGFVVAYCCMQRKKKNQHVD